MDVAGAKHPLAAVERSAGNAFQCDGRRLHQPHFTSFFVNETIDASADTEDLAAEWHEFGVDREPPV